MILTRLNEDKTLFHQEVKPIAYLTVETLKFVIRIIQLFVEPEVNFSYTLLHVVTFFFRINKYSENAF